MQIYQKATKLEQQGRSIFIRWVLSLSRITKNERANKTAKEATVKEKIREAKWTCLTYVKQQIKE